MATKDMDGLGDLVKNMLAQRLDEEMTKRVDEWHELFESIDSSLASLVEAAERSNGKSLADALAKAFSQIKMPAPAPAQQLPAPQVVVSPEFKVPPAPAPTVVLPPNDATFDVEFKYGNGGRLIGMTVSRKSVSHAG